MKTDDWRLPRIHKFVKDLNAFGGYTGDDGKTVPEAEANIVTSMLSPALHAPVLDIDFGAELVPSSTPGHFHLYLEKAMVWGEYVKLLSVLGDCGILEKGFVDASLARGYSSVRKQGVYKQEET